MPAGGPDDGITHARLCDAVSKTTVSNEEAEGFALSPTEALSDHLDLDQPMPTIGEELDGDKSDQGDLTVGDQSTHSDESASCEKVARICEGIVDTCLVRGATIPPEVQAEEPVIAQQNPYGEDHGAEPAAPVLMPHQAAASF